MNRLYVAVGALLVMLCLVYTVLHLYTAGVKSEVKASIATETVSRAVAASKTEVIREYQVQAELSATLDAVRPVYAILRKTNVPAPKAIPVVIPEGAVLSAVVPSDPWISMFNSAVRTSNSTIESASSMP